MVSILLLELAGYVGLLLWGTHMVTTGVQRGFGTDLRIWLEHNLRQRWRAFCAGVGLTALLQSSTATALMTTAFTANGVLALGPALAVMLGANVGSTIVTQVLSFDTGLVAPPLVLGGVLAFRWSGDDRVRNAGRIAIGIGLMLMALSGLTHQLASVEGAPALADVLGALESEPVLALAIAALLTSCCHSSVAVVLLVVSLATTHVVTPVGALVLVLGANLGGTLPPLFEAGTATARRLPLGNMLIRAAGCAVALPLLPYAAAWLVALDPSPGRTVVDFHTIFNLVLAMIFIGPVDLLGRMLARLLPDAPKPIDPGHAVYLDPAALEAASIALTGAVREALRMSDMVEAMLRNTSEVLHQNDRRRASEVSRTDRDVDRLGGAIRAYLADLGNAQPLDDEKDGARAQEILAAVINIEHAGDIVANNLMEFAASRFKRGRPFSGEELGLIDRMLSETQHSLRIGAAVLFSGNPDEATRLLSRKKLVHGFEAQAMALHVRSLREAALFMHREEEERFTSVAENGGEFLRIVRDLRRVHSHVAALAYPPLYGLEDGSSTLQSVPPESEPLVRPVHSGSCNPLSHG